LDAPRIQKNNIKSDVVSLLVERCRTAGQTFLHSASSFTHSYLDESPLFI
jgi:hypothetical protein